jgi:hypothetical protein
MEKYSRESIYAELKKYCTFSDDGYFIEVTKWTNGEGYDINKTEIKIMNDRGYYRIFDCGSKKWIY